LTNRKSLIKLVSQQSECN